MKRIILFLLSIILVLLPSCDNQVQNPDFNKVDIDALPKTTLSVLINEKEYEPNEFGKIMYIMSPLSKDSTFDSVVVKVENTGTETAMIKFSSGTRDSNMASIESDVPEKLMPGEMTCIKFSYSVPSEIGLPDAEIGGFSFHGNFDDLTISFYGRKTDVPMISLNARDFSKSPSILLRSSIGDIPNFVISNFNARENNRITLDYSFYRQTELKCRLESMEIAGDDASYFSESFVDDSRIQFNFTPNERRRYTAKVKLTVLCSDFKSYERSFNLLIDVSELDRSFLSYDEALIYDTMIYSMTAAPDGHLYINTLDNEGSGFIELDEKDQMVSWVKGHVAFTPGLIVDSWFDPITSKVNLLIQTARKKNDYCVESYDVDSDVLGMEKLPIEAYDTNYIGQSKEYLIFTRNGEITLYDKHSATTIHTPVPDKSIIDLYYIQDTDTYIFADKLNNVLWSTRYDTTEGWSKGHLLKLGSDFHGVIKEFTKVDNTYYVLNDFNELYLAPTAVGPSRMLLHTDYNLEKMQYANGKLFLLDKQTCKAYAFDIANEKLFPLHEMIKISRDSDYSILVRNNKIYYSAWNDPFNNKRPVGYIRRISM